MTFFQLLKARLFGTKYVAFRYGSFIYIAEVYYTPNGNRYVRAAWDQLSFEDAGNPFISLN